MRPFAALAALALVAAPAFADNAPAPAPRVPKGAYTVDRPHTSLTFRVNHLGFSNFTARFTDVTADLAFDPEHIAASSVKVAVDPRSIESDNAPGGFHEMLTGEQFLDAAKYSQLTFVSKSVQVTGPRTFRIQGDLTLHGVTKPVTLDARYNGGYAGHPMDPHARVGFSATAKFPRSEFGITIGIPSAAMPFGVGDEVQVTLESEFSGPALAQAAAN